MGEGRMRAYGNVWKDCGKGLVELSKITIEANQDELRRIAGFILVCAAEMERSRTWNHEHFEIGQGKHAVELIVYNPRSRS